MMMADASPRTRRVPVLILNFNRWDETFAGIETMQAYLSDLWLVDNGSDDDRTAEAEARFPHLRTLRLPENGGWASGYNRALRVVLSEGYDTAYLLNNDAIPQPGAVESAVATLRSCENCAAVGSVILQDAGKRVTFDGEYFHFKNHAERQASVLRPGVRPVRTLHGAGFALSMRAFAALGPFPEDYFLYWEEADWFITARQRGWNLVLDGASIVMHEGSASDSNDNAKYYRTRNRFLALRRRVSISGEQESPISLIHEELQRARRGDANGRRSMREGLLDGLLGRFGRRGRPWSPLVLHPATAALSMVVLPYRLLRKLADRSSAPATGLSPSRAADQ
ncbi:glycosyltransferase family 2 protein [Phenylobacterium sp.]|uniref:glycosyltransferase family 2 protein n=1 Tax=Phenylobacterium sp. TaxID=1871053 RepID=UPI002FCA9646